MKLNLVFIHCAGGSARIWRNQVRYFKNAFAVDLPGHDGGRGRRTIDDYVEVVNLVLKDKGLKNVAMIGSSMGGAITIKYALLYPQHLKAIVLVGTGARLRVTPIILNAIREDYSKAIDIITDFSFSAKTRDDLKKEFSREMARLKPEVTYGDYEACDKFDCMSEISNIKLPTLIVCGSDDRLTPVKYSKFLKDHIANSKLSIIEDAGHMVMLERPKKFNEVLDKFISEIQSSSCARREF